MEKRFLGYPIYLKRRRFQRSINVSVHINGVIRITTGRSVSEARIFKFLEENKIWLEKVQAEHAHVKSLHPPKRFIEGEKFLYLGNPVPLSFQDQGKGRLTFEFQEGRLVCHKLYFKTYSPEEYHEALIKCYEKAGRKWLQFRVNFWSHKMHLYPKKLSYRSQKTRWGSCSSNGDISLNWRLVAAPLPVLDYVVIHELAHLKHPNHSKDFWALVKTYDDNHKYNRKWLREQQWSFDFLANRSELYSAKI